MASVPTEATPVVPCPVLASSFLESRRYNSKYDTHDLGFKETEKIEVIPKDSAHGSMDEHNGQVSTKVSYK